MTILMYGADWCGDCRRTKRQLDELGLDYSYLDVEHDDALRDAAVSISGAQSIPVVVFPDGTHLVEPSNPALRAKLIDLGLIQA
ncbi:MAG: NrdH-redoxin [Actinomycetales bacterium]|nr:NrdH-redoxin [Actinomycetales bacterium]